MTVSLPHGGGRLIARAGLMTQDDSGLPEAERAEGCGDSGVHGLSACGRHTGHM